MKFSKAGLALAFAVLCATAFAGSSDPGAAALASASPAPASLAPISGPSPIRITAPADRTAQRLWLSSIAALAAASAADAATSWGKREANPLLASSNGTFGAKGVNIKIGVGAATILPQILLRHHRNAQLRFAVANLAAAGAYGVISVHNMGVAAPAH